MKKGVLYSLAAIILVSACSMDEVYKLPRLITHFQEHLKENRELDLFQFLAMHYAGDSHQDDRHETLPFKKVDNAGSVVLFLQQNVAVMAGPVNAAAAQSTHYKSFFKPGTFSSLFRPPRFA